MKIFNKILFLSLLSVLVLALLAIAGCGEKETAPGTTQAATSELSQQEIQQVINDSMLSIATLKTYKFDGNTDMAMESTGGDEPFEMKMAINMTGIFDMAEREMKMNMDMSMESEMMPPDLDMQNVSMEMYLIADSFYMKMDMPQVGEQWLKMPFSEEMKELYNLDIVDQQLEMLKSVTDLKLLRYESYDGSECYVLEMVPDIAAIMSWLGQQLPTDVPLESLEIASKMFDELTYTVWVTKDTRLLKKMDAKMIMKMDAADFGGEDTDFEKMTVDMTMTMRIYDQDVPVSITLPPEAEDAIEIPMGGIPSEI
jgi:hypothetical protein